MKVIIRKMRIRALKANLKLSRIACSMLARENCQRCLTTEQNIQIVRRWDAVVREESLLNLNLVLLEGLRDAEGLAH